MTEIKKDRKNDENYIEAEEGGESHIVQESENDIKNEMNNISKVSQLDKSLSFETTTTYFTELEKLMKSEIGVEDKINMLDLLIKDFLRKKYHIKKTDEYSDMIDFFLQKNKPQIATLCHEMIESLYSGDKIDAIKIGVIVDDFKNVLSGERDIPINKSGEPSFKNIFDPISNIFSRFKHKTNKVSNLNPKYVSKQVKKIVDDSMASNSQSDMEEFKELQANKQIISSVSNKYPVEKMLSEIPSNEFLEHPSISSIDDLERIKQKVKQRKFLIYNSLNNLNSVST